jgi:hypothetical protein
MNGFRFRVCFCVSSLHINATCVSVERREERAVVVVVLFGFGSRVEAELNLGRMFCGLLYNISRVSITVSNSNHAKREDMIVVGIKLMRKKK